MQSRYSLRLIFRRHRLEPFKHRASLRIKGANQSRAFCYGPVETQMNAQGGSPTCDTDDVVVARDQLRVLVWRGDGAAELDFAFLFATIGIWCLCRGRQEQCSQKGTTPDNPLQADGLSQEKVAHNGCPQWL